ncbi:large ribosomal subunit protein mL63 [Amia ocellicauda]|uniref:large ribosomal subunit protein mL63 n=1 Tax=Amia ocellicauda TaxID=2972642 RepID=UPI003463B4F2|nr:RT63 protein [Amia calva]
MFLTVALFRKGIPGKQWIGKYRRPRQVTWQMKRNVIERLEIEAENEYWLSRPYMSAEQERGHSAERRMINWTNLKAAKAANFPEHRYVADHLGHLNISKKWSVS